MSNTTWDVDESDDLDFDLSVIDGYEDDNEALKFDLYLMTRQLSQISDSLKTVSLLPVIKKRTWVTENQVYLQSLMDRLVNDVSAMFEDIDLDRDALDDSIACVTELRKLIGTLHDLLADGRQLRG